ncbi:MAG: hypothetical protein V1708_02450 [Candidatus Micrarchaeota archaeon]
MSEKTPAYAVRMTSSLARKKDRAIQFVWHHGKSFLGLGHGDQTPRRILNEFGKEIPQGAEDGFVRGIADGHRVLLFNQPSALSSRAGHLNHALRALLQHSARALKEPISANTPVYAEAHADDEHSGSGKYVEGNWLPIGRLEHVLTLLENPSPTFIRVVLESQPAASSPSAKPVGRPYSKPAQTSKPAPAAKPARVPPAKFVATNPRAVSRSSPVRQQPQKELSHQELADLFAGMSRSGGSAEHMADKAAEEAKAGRLDIDKALDAVHGEPFERLFEKLMGERASLALRQVRTALELAKNDLK